MTIAKAKTSVSLLDISPFKISGAAHCMLYIHCVVSLGGSEGPTTSLSGIVVSRLKPTRQARLSSLTRIFDFRGWSTLCGMERIEYNTYPFQGPMDGPLLVYIN